MNQAAPSPQQLCKIAIGFHERGDFAEAERLYLQLLSADPAPEPVVRFNAQHMLAIIRHQQGRPEEAIALMGDALKINSDIAEVQAIYALMLRTVGRFADAL